MNEKKKERVRKREQWEDNHFILHMCAGAGGSWRQKKRPDKEAVAAAMLPFSGLSLPESNMSCFFPHPHPQPSHSEPDLVMKLSGTHRRVNTTG